MYNHEGQDRGCERDGTERNNADVGHTYLLSEVGFLHHRKVSSAVSTPSKLTLPFTPSLLFVPFGRCPGNCTEDMDDKRDGTYVK